MMRDPANAFGLLERPAGAVLFRRAGRAIDAASFLRDVMRCADGLPEGLHVVNCCSDRYWFAVAFAAFVLRGQISLLTGDFSDRALRGLAGRYDSVYALSQAADFASPLRSHVLRECPADAAAMPDVPRVAGEQAAVIAFTSGSTGTPVGTAKSFGELAARSRAAGAVFGFDEARPATIVGTVPPHHMYGFETTILLPLHASAASWCEPVFYPADLQAPLAAAPAPRVLVTTPLQLRAMVAAPEWGAAPEMVISATAPLDAGLAGEAERRFGCQAMEIFGATEVGSIASRRTKDGADWTLYPGVRMVGEDQPAIEAPGAPVRRLSDVVTLAPGGGRFRLLGRSGDMVKLGGRRASLAGLTRILIDLPGVEDGIFIAPEDIDRRPNARLMAFVVAPALSDTHVLDALRGAIDQVFLPRPLVRVDRLPRNDVGKVPRQALLSLVPQLRAGAG